MPHMNLGFILSEGLNNFLIIAKGGQDTIFFI